MYSEEEKQAFARRLRRALDFAPKRVKGATDLAVQFNLRHAASPVSTQTAHKWLIGRTIPTADKIDVLSAWLGVSAHWLRFGSPSGADSPVLLAAEPKTALPTYAAEGVIEAQDVSNMILRLPMHQRQLVLALVWQLLGADMPPLPSRRTSPARAAR